MSWEEHHDTIIMRESVYQSISLVSLPWESWRHSQRRKQSNNHFNPIEPLEWNWNDIKFSGSSISFLFCEGRLNFLKTTVVDQHSQWRGSTGNIFLEEKFNGSLLLKCLLARKDLDFSLTFFLRTDDCPLRLLMWWWCWNHETQERDKNSRTLDNQFERKEGSWKSASKQRLPKRGLMTWKGYKINCEIRFSWYFVHEVERDTQEGNHWQDDERGREWNRLTKTEKKEWEAWEVKVLLKAQ